MQCDSDWMVVLSECVYPFWKLVPMWKIGELAFLADENPSLLEKSFDQNL